MLKIILSSEGRSVHAGKRTIMPSFRPWEREFSRDLGLETKTEGSVGSRARSLKQNAGLN